MPQPLFYLFTALMLGFGICVVVLRNPVSAALSLVMSFVGLAALYVSLDAYFIGTLQILVYAGAVMVLFLFIIMLLDIKAEQRRPLNKPAVIGGSVLVFGLVLQIATVLGEFKASRTSLKNAPIDYAAAVEARKTQSNATASATADLQAGALPDAKLIGETLYHKYPFHLQIVGVLLLVATLGVVVLSRREDRRPASPAVPPVV